MAGFDVPHIAHDMILRFMGVNFSAISSPEGSIRIPSAVGDDSKPVPVLLDSQPTTTPISNKTPEQDKAMWEGILTRCLCLYMLTDSHYIPAYYNAGSAALVLVLIALAIGVFLWWRRRKNRLTGLLRSPRVGGEESIPLTESNGHYADAEREIETKEEFLSRKGKERASNRGLSPAKDVIFRVTDDSDDEDGPRGSHA